ncbi:unnamed protein product, partial [Symbiodinium microadriaticum]
SSSSSSSSRRRTRSPSSQTSRTWRRSRQLQERSLATLRVLWSRSTWLPQVFQIRARGRPCQQVSLRLPVWCRLQKCRLHGWQQVLATCRMPNTMVVAAATSMVSTDGRLWSWSYVFWSWSRGRLWSCTYYGFWTWCFGRLWSCTYGFCNWCYKRLWSCSHGFWNWCYRRLWSCTSGLWNWCYRRLCSCTSGLWTWSMAATDWRLGQRTSCRERLGIWWWGDASANWRLRSSWWPRHLGCILRSGVDMEPMQR